MEFLVAFEFNIPDGTPESEVESRERSEAIAVAKLAEEGHVVRIWKLHAASGESKILGLYRADGDSQLHRMLVALPLYEWMHITVTPLESHPNDPVSSRATI